MTDDLPVNTYDQLVKAGYGVAISPRHIGIRETSVFGFEVWKATERGVERFKHEFDVDMSLPFHERQAKALTAAQKWCERVLGIKGPWARNHMGDVIPASIHKAFPLRRRTRATE